jgi:hypothetical protein
MSNDRMDDKPLAAEMEERQQEQWERYRLFKEVTSAEPAKKRKSQENG